MAARRTFQHTAAHRYWERLQKNTHEKLPAAYSLVSAAGLRQCRSFHWLKLTLSRRKHAKPAETTPACQKSTLSVTVVRFIEAEFRL
jgi:hypothetical protein